MLSDKERGVLSPKVPYLCAAGLLTAGLISILQRGFFFAEDVYPFAAGWFALWTLVIGYWIIAVHTKDEFHNFPGKAEMKGSIAVVIMLSCPFLIGVLYAFSWLRGPLSAQGTMNELLRWSLYGTFAVLAYISTGNKGATRLLVAGWHAVGMTLSISSLLAVCGGLPIPYSIAYSSAPGVSVTGARLGGLLQYPNTFGAIMAVFLLERLFAVSDYYAGRAGEPRRVAALLRMLPLFPYAAALLLSESRGAWLAAACACAAALPWKRRLLAPLLAAGAAPVAAAALLYRQLAAARLAVEPLPGLLALAGLWAGAVLAGLWLCRRQRSLAGGGRAAVLVLAALGWTAGAAAVLLHVHARITGPSSTVAARVLLYRDAWRLAAEAPWLGRGGETWRSLYLAAQSRPYVGSQVHSGYLDILLNLGIAGLAAVALMLAAMCWLLAVHSARLLPPFLVIVLHSAVDFDFSYGLVWLLVFWLPALAFADARGTLFTQAIPANSTLKSSDRMSIHTRTKTIAAAAVCCSSLVLCLISWRAQMGAGLYRAAMVASNPAEKKVLLQQSLHWNQLSPRTAAALSEQLPKERSKSLLKNSLSYSPENPALNWVMAEIFMGGDNPGAALYWVRRSLSLDVYNYGKRTKAIDGMLLLSQRRLAAGDKEGALRSAASGLELLRQYRLLADNADGGRYNDRSFHLTEQAVSIGQRLKSLIFVISAK
ncbi:O-antigen ligase family protein [Paenibacillus sp. BR2-3]|uniref:O-antigen ligase family protein n=1 Tax=Paenibacillus sp. BR2-3 TaxID=3048494 RepID=UPI003977BF21